MRWSMIRLAGYVLVFGLCAGCNNYADLMKQVDYMTFETIGGTIFGNPEQVTTKELHFDVGKMIGREVILEGQVVSYDKHGTHFVVDDEFGRMLVVLTHFAGSKEALDLEGRVRVLGFVERGKMGLPVVLARSLSMVEDNAEL